MSPYRRALLGTMTLAALMVAASALPSFAVPLKVKFRSELEVNARYVQSGIDLAGHLRRADGRGLERKVLHISVDGAHGRSVATDTSGAFGVRVALSDDARRKPRRWQVSYDGDGLAGSCSASGEIQPERRSTRVGLTVQPTRLSLHDPPMRISAWIRDGEESMPIPSARLTLQVGEGPEAVAQADERGEAVFYLQADEIGALGALPVQVGFDGSETHLPAFAAEEVQIMRPTRVNLVAGLEGDRESGRFRFSGRVIDDEGPVANGVVVLVPAMDDKQADESTRKL